jgi:membrane protease YdiL (CAAX protease family)
MFIKQGWLRALIVMIVWMFVAYCFHLVADEFFDYPELKLSDVDYHLLSIGLTFAATFITVYFSKKFIDRESLKEMGIISFKSGQLFGAGALLGIIIIASGFLILLQMGKIVPLRNEDTTTLTMIKGVLLYLLVALNEEFLLRGYVQVNLSLSFNKYVALLLTSSLFAFLHIFNMGITNISLLNLTLSGILLGINFLFIRNIWYSVGLHFTWNYVQGFIFGFHVSGISNPSLLKVNYYQPDFWNGGAFGFEGSLMCTILCVAAIVAMYFYFRKYALLTSEAAPENEIVKDSELS